MILVLLVLVVLVAVVAELSFHAGVEYRAGEALERQKQLGWALRSGLLYAKELAAREESPGGVSFSLEVGGVSVEGTLEDEDGKLCVNSLVSEEGEVDAVMRSALEFVLSEQAGSEAAKEVVEGARDWLDADSAGAYESNAPNRPFLLLEELLRLPGMDRAILYGGGSGGAARFITVWSDGKVNVNTAPEEVLRALLGEEGSKAAEAIVERREQAEFRELSEVEILIGELPEELRDKLAFFSLVFKVRLEARSETVVRMGEGVLKVGSEERRPVEVVAWREWWPEE